MSKILIVDDEPLVLALLTRVLSDAGYQPLGVPCGEDALKVIADREERIDLLLTDLQMPGMSGQELTARALTLRPNLPVIFMSGFSDRAVAGSALPPGVQFLQKPFNRNSLLTKLMAVLLEKRPSASVSIARAANG